MSTHRNRSVLNRSKCSSEYHKKWLAELYPMYWDDGINLYPKQRRGFKNSNKSIYSYQMRMYRTWKHNRKTRWKETK